MGRKPVIAFLSTVGAFALGLALAGFGFRFAAAMHTRRDRRRWWIQAAALLVAYGAIGMAAWTASFVERLGRH